jgi:hypothetical protein
MVVLVEVVGQIKMLTIQAAQEIRLLYLQVKEIMGEIVIPLLCLTMALEVVVEHQQQVVLVPIPQEEVAVQELHLVFLAYLYHMLEAVAVLLMREEQ